MARPVMEWPADKIERRKVADLVPYARNARTHSPEQIDQIAASIREWGFTNPLLLDEADGIIAGHGRVLGAKKLGIDELPCMVARGWTKAQKAAYVLADNKLAQNAGWDNELLALEFADLQSLDFDLGLTGFDIGELRTIVFPADKKSSAAQLDGMLYQVIIECDDEAAQFELLERFESEGLKCRALIS